MRRLPHVLTPEQVMVEGKRPPGGRVAIVDYEGYFTGAALAEQLRGEGYEVEFVTCHEAIAPYADQTLEGRPVRQRLHELGIRLVRAVMVSGSILAASSWWASSARPPPSRSTASCWSPSASPTTPSTGSSSVDPEALEREGIEAVYRIGDCVAPRLIADAIFDGHRLAREIDSPDPARPLPYLRERPLVPVTVPS